MPDGIRDYVRGGGKTYMTEEPVNGKARISPDVEGSMGIFVPEGQFRQEVRVKEGHNAFLNGAMERHVADGGKLYTMGVPEMWQGFYMCCSDFYFPYFSIMCYTEFMEF